MKKIFILSMAISFALLSACKKDMLTTVSSNVAGPTLTTNPADGTSVTISPTDTAQTLTATWSKVNYGVPAVVTYFVQVDSAGRNFSKAITLGTTSAATMSLSYGAFNSKLISGLNMPANAAVSVQVRTGAAIYGKDTVFSKPVSLNITTYQAIIYSHGWPVLWVPGDFQGWSPGTAPTVAAEGNGNVYEGYINEPAGGTYQLKFTNSPDWNHLTYGDNGGGTISSTSTNNLQLPGPGYYELVCNPVTLTWNYTLTTWSIIGDATPGGWNTDTQMQYSASTGLWTVTAAMVTGGSFKFRVNDAWNIDFGIDSNGRLAYADNPAYAYNGTLANLTVPVSGTYTITLDLRNPNDYNYTLQKN
jgi:starch-binding outer membrane protein SusE/F